jgi:TonB family protein
LKLLMSRPNHSLTVALCVSLLAHGLALSGLAWWYIEHTSSKLPPIDKYVVMADQMVREAAAKQPPPPPPPPSPPKSASKPPPPPAPKKLDKPKPTHKDDSGEANGTGTANRSTPGAQPMQANSGYEQADLMREAKDFADSAFLPASAGKPAGNNAMPKKSPKSGSYVPDAIAQANPLSDPTVTTPATPVPTDGPGPYPKITETHVTGPTASGTKSPVANVPLAQLPTPNPTQKEIRGHRATASDTESIAFAGANSAVFRAGRLEGRKGLRVKTTQVRFHDSSEADIQLLGGIRTVVSARVDADGNVLDVQIVESSGSENVDEDCKLAVWNWTLEPQKDKDGHPTDLNWTIAFE